VPEPPGRLNPALYRRGPSIDGRLPTGEELFGQRKAADAFRVECELTRFWLPADAANLKPFAAGDPAVRKPGFCEFEYLVEAVRGFDQPEVGITGKSRVEGSAF